jgi:hypothetical protein
MAMASSLAAARHNYLFAGDSAAACCVCFYERYIYGPSICRIIIQTAPTFLGLASERGFDIIVKNLVNAGQASPIHLSAMDKIALLDQA